MTDFEKRMKELAESLSPEAKFLVKHILEREHRLRFGDRAELPESYALEALRQTQTGEDGQ